MKTSLFLFAFVSFSAVAADITCEYPESTGNEQKIEVNINYRRNTATVKVNGRYVSACKDAPFTTTGIVDDYGQGEMTINCKGGKKVIYQNDFDERYIDVGQLRLKLGDDRYSC